jgi:hypothetical protein
MENTQDLGVMVNGREEPEWSCVFTIDENGAIVCCWRLVMGCNVFTCLCLCDKAMSGFCIDGFVGRAPLSTL